MTFPSQSLGRLCSQGSSTLGTSSPLTTLRATRSQRRRYGSGFSQSTGFSASSRLLAGSVALHHSARRATGHAEQCEHHYPQRSDPPCTWKLRFRDPPAPTCAAPPSLGLLTLNRVIAPPSWPSHFNSRKVLNHNQVKRYSSHSTMSIHQAIADLSKKAEGLNLDTLQDDFPNAHPETNPLDVWRVHISNTLSKISGAPTDVIYRSIQWTSTLDKGDFLIAVPALRIKGQKPDVLGPELASKVRL